MLRFILSSNSKYYLAIRQWDHPERAFLRRWLTLGTNHRPVWHVFEILEEIYSSGDPSEAFNEAKKIVSLGKSAKKALARARFIQAQILEKEFYNQSVKSKAERITVVLALKTEKLEKAQQAYQGFGE